MDDPGFHARYRAHREQLEAQRNPRRYEETRPLEDEYAHIQQQISVPQAEEHLTGYQDSPSYRPPPAIPASQIPGATQGGEGLQGALGGPGPAAGSAAAKHLRMQPHLQMMCGPMLRYDTVADGVYHAFALAVTADNGSDYTTTPHIVYRYTRAAHSLEAQFQQSVSLDPTHSDAQGGKEEMFRVEGQKVWIYRGLSGSNSFWRFKLEVALGETEMAVHYALNGGKELAFYVPGRNQNMRWVGHSCNGFSAGVDTEAFNGPDPLWNDLLKRHAQQPIHLLVGGGDQIYCDSMALEPELSGWIGEKDDKKKIAAVLTDDIRFAVDRFLFNHYCNWFRNGAFGRAIACIPMANMLDDHDIIDGFGSYPDDLMTCPVFSHIGSRGIFFYQLFQLFIVDEMDGTQPGAPHCNLSLIMGGPGPYVKFNNHSFFTYLGPQVRLLMLDGRTERRLDQIASPYTYSRIFDVLRTMPAEVEHLVVLLGVPIAYPRMVFAEKLMTSKLNPMMALSKAGVPGLGGLTNNFNSDAELADDLNDHWTAAGHKPERNWLIVELQKVAVAQRVRITFLSGDVHLAAVGRLFDLRKIPAERDPKYMLNIISSAIVNTPPPMAVVGLQGKLNRTHKTLHHEHTDENMLELFQVDTDGKKLKNHCFLGRRNYCLAQVLPSGDLECDIRMEVSQGAGETKGYPVAIPPPRW